MREGDPAEREDPAEKAKSDDDECLAKLCITVSIDTLIDWRHCGPKDKGPARIMGGLTRSQKYNQKGSGTF